MSELLLLDGFCGAGGCAEGYRRVGFTPVGVDVEPQPSYPFEFHQADALAVLAALISGETWQGYRLEDFAAIHTSPPCQDYSKRMSHLAAPQPRLIEPTRELLERTGRPWVIENVVGAPLPTGATLDGRFGVELCGTMFGLRVWRHRLFETTFPIEAPCPCDHSQPAFNPHNQKGRDRIYAETGRGDPEPRWRDEMEVGWMRRYEAREAVPPRYTEFVGAQLLRSRRCTR